MLVYPLSRKATTILRFTTLLLAIACASSLLAQLPITVAKSFNPSTVPIGGTSTTTMTVTITNPNGFSVNGISFSDTYPAGLVPDQVGAYTCSAGNAVFQGSGWSLSNVTLGAGASCSVPMLMHATTLGQITNSTSQVTGTGVPPSQVASAILNVIPAATPALSEGMLLLLGIAIATISIVRIRG